MQPQTLEKTCPAAMQTMPNPDMKINGRPRGCVLFACVSAAL
jgi:hypothetical protein